MDFKDALDCLVQGLAMRRAAWPEAEGYLKILPGMKFVWKIVLVPNPNAGNFIFSLEDFHGDDWEEFLGFKECVEAECQEAEVEVA